MKILGSGKLDDFNKVQLSDKTVKALNVKSGDSILFSRGGGHTVQVFKAEGANLSSEVDMAPPERYDNKQAAIVLIIAAVILVAFCVWFFMFSKFVDLSVMDPNSLDFQIFLIAIMAVIILVVTGLMMQFSHKVESVNPQSIVTFSGPYSKNRLFGISKFSSDGHILTGNLYVNALFGTNPSNIECRVFYADGSVEPVLYKCTKDVPGYCTYKLRVPAGDLTNGKLDVAINYVYSGKAIVARTTLDLSSNKNDAMTVKVAEGPITAELVFGPEFQTAKFDESLFDPTESEA